MTRQAPRVQMAAQSRRGMGAQQQWGSAGVALVLVRRSIVAGLEARSLAPHGAFCQRRQKDSDEPAGRRAEQTGKRAKRSVRRRGRCSPGAREQGPASRSGAREANALRRSLGAALDCQASGRAALAEQNRPTLMRSALGHRKARLGARARAWGRLDVVGAAPPAGEAAPRGTCAPERTEQRNGCERTQARTKGANQAKNRSSGTGEAEELQEREGAQRAPAAG